VWIGVGLSCWIAYSSSSDPDWTSEAYETLTPATAPMLIGVSLASISAFGRELVPVSDSAPMTAAGQAVARLLGGLALVGVVGLVVGSWELWYLARGGIAFGDEPGRTLHAQHTLPEMLQPILLACLAVAVGAAAVHLTRSRVVASILIFVTWYVCVSMYWLSGFIGPLRWLAPAQVQPFWVNVAPVGSDPYRLPETWLLERPGEFQDYWARLVISPEVAAVHDVYVMGLTVLTLAVVVPGRWRRRLLLAGAAIAVVAAPIQPMVSP
jgi:hypothetical protein